MYCRKDAIELSRSPSYGVSFSLNAHGVAIASSTNPFAQGGADIFRDKIEFKRGKTAILVLVLSIFVPLFKFMAGDILPIITEFFLEQMC